NLLVAQDIKTPVVTTIHAQPFEEFDEAFSKFDKNTYLISISEAHKKLFQKTDIYKVIYNGIDTQLYSFKEKKDDYLLWLGRLSKAKNPDGTFQDPKGIRWAIQLAQETNSKLLLSGNVEDLKFFEQDVKPHLNDKIQWVGPISSELSLTKTQVVELMQKAKCFLMTINWYEPFGLVMAESMSCGTPVIGFDRGAVKEIIDDGKTGFVVSPEEGIEGLKKALQKIDIINPKACRDYVIRKFSQEHMVDAYETTYKDLIADYKNK
ncbi:MAG TPA: glycosyltransferase, partial [Candidatus Woesebacteria bacterium]|nr:glycosyltransferase [Candidatus Woesebacteria bacterium]